MERYLNGRRLVLRLLTICRGQKKKSSSIMKGGLMPMDILTTSFKIIYFGLGIIEKIISIKNNNRPKSDKN